MTDQVDREGVKFDLPMERIAAAARGAPTMTDCDPQGPTYVWSPSLRPPKPGDHRPNLGGGRYEIKCDECRAPIGRTDSVERSAQGGRCTACREADSKGTDR